MKKFLIVISLMVLCTIIFMSNATFACDCGCKKSESAIEISCPQDCDCGCQNGEECSCDKTTESCKKCTCNKIKKYFKIFKKCKKTKKECKKGCPLENVINE